MSAHVGYRGNKALRRRMALGRLSTEGARRARRAATLAGCACGGRCGCGRGLGYLGNFGGAEATGPSPNEMVISASGAAAMQAAIASAASEFSIAPGLGFLGDTTETGELAGKAATAATALGISSAAGAITGAATAAGGAAVGAAVGSVLPVVGTVIGAVVGFLVSGLFGKANQQAIEQDVLARMQMADAYKQLAGQFPGRMYGLNELLLVWYGLLHEDYFPQAEACSGAVLESKYCPPQYPTCECGAETWANGMMNGTANYEFPAIIASANEAGVTDPQTVVSEYILPGIQSLTDGEKNAYWAIPSNSKDANLVTQLYIDIVDAYEAHANPNLPVTYGTGIASAASAAPASAPAPAPAPATATVTPTVTATPQRDVASTYSAAGTTITPQDGNTLSTPTGVLGFGAQYDAAGDHIVLEGGVSYGQFGIAITYTGAASIVTRADGSQWQWGGVGHWVGLSAASTTTPAAPPAAPPSTAAQSTSSPPTSSSTGPPANIAAEYQAIGLDSSGNTVYEDSAGALWEWANGQMQPWSGTSLARSYLSPPGSYTLIGADSDGDPVYSDGTGLLYQWNGWRMMSFTGLMSDGHTAAQWQGMLQTFIAQGDSIATAVAATEAAWEGAVSEPASVEDVTYNAPAPEDTESYYTGAVAPATPAETPVATATASTSSSHALLWIGGAAAVGIIALAAFGGHHGRHRHR